eukprot:m.21288 g.21288  ORF g.21288 m.21288 type:complete len:383 (-) comp12372_c0_seq2:175-1323(-)
MPQGCNFIGCVYTCTWVCVHVCAHVCMCVTVYSFVCIYVCVCVGVCLCDMIPLGQVLVMVAILIFLPLSLLRNIEPLKYTSFVSFMATLYAAFLLGYVSFTNTESARLPSQEHRGSITYASFPVAVFGAIPIINVAFTAHYNGPRYYQELKQRSMPRFGKVIFIGMFFSLVCYTFCAITGYIFFGENTVDDVLKNFAPGFELAIVARLALACVVIFTFPLANNALRASMVNIFYAPRYTPDTLPLRLHFMLTAGVVVVATTLGIVCENVSVVLAYKGSIFGSNMVYIFPPLMYVQLLRQQKPHAVMGRSSSGVTEPLLDANGGDAKNRDALVPKDFKGALLDLFTWKHKWLAGMVVWGVVTMVLGVTVTVLHQAHVDLMHNS